MLSWNSITDHYSMCEMDTTILDKILLLIHPFHITPSECCIVTILTCNSLRLNRNCQKAAVSLKPQRLGEALTALFVMCCFDMYPVGMGYELFVPLYFCLQAKERNPSNKMLEHNPPRSEIHKDDEEEERCRDFFFNNMETRSFWRP